MDDKEISNRISALIDEEHKLERAGHEPNHERLRAIDVELDTCWDLLRQRRARRAAGENPDEAEPRPEGVVEGYLQ
jgi:Protein of unknown function (DUF2630)